MSKLGIYLFGPPRIEVDDRWVNLKTHKAIGLIAYLSISQERHSREVISSLFWPRSDQSSASASLRTTLWRIKKAGLQKWFLIDRNSLKMDLSKNTFVDVVNFQEKLRRINNHEHSSTAPCDICISLLEDAVGMYHSGFMEGYYVKNSREYEEWQSFHQERLRFDFSSAITRLVETYRRQGKMNKALEYTNRWLTTDPYHDEANRLLISLYADVGQRESALKHYNDYVRILKQDLNISPDEATTQLIYEIKNGVHNTKGPRSQQYSGLMLYVDFSSVSNQLILDEDINSDNLSAYIDLLTSSIRNFGGKILNIQHQSLIAHFDDGNPINCALFIQSERNPEFMSLSADQFARIVISVTDKYSLHDISNSKEYLDVKRLSQSAWDGQILITTQALTIADLPDGVDVIDFGFHVLRDLSEPIQVFGLNHPNLTTQGSYPPRTMKGYPHNLPSQTTPFVGREYEISLITSLLDDPVYHLISLVGPGGIGKTRLALQIAANQIERFSDGVFYFPLNSITKPDLFYPELGNILGFRFSSQEKPEEQILNYLRGKQMLLILDNFENLLHGPMVLIELIQKLPTIKILITSRERSNLHMEWVQEIHGLPFPDEGVEANIDQYSACKLFIHSAKRVYPDFDPDDEQKKCIADISRTVEGSPLAIELAASWARSVPCCEIADQVKNNLDFLSATMQDLPPRHHSLRAVFDSSWALLSEEERRLLRKLSIFRGSFRREAAENIANASTLTLTNCADKSLLRYNPDGRYEMLESIRYFAEEKLNNVPNEKSTLTHNYCNYYGSWLNKCEHELLGHNQLDTLKELRKDIKNTYHAWNLAIDTSNYETLDNSINTLFRFHEILCLYRDGREYFQNALDKTSEDTNFTLVKIKAQSRLGWFLMRLGHQTEGVNLMLDSLHEARKYNLLNEIIFLLNHLGEAYRLVGEYDRSKDFVSDSICLLESEGHTTDRYRTFAHAQAMLQLGVLHYSFDRLNEARDKILESIASFEKIGGSWWVAKAFNSLGVVISKMEDYEQAIRLRQKSLKLFRELGDKRGTAVTLNNLASNYFSLGRSEEVIDRALESLRISREIGDLRFASIVMQNLAKYYLVLKKDFPSAEKYYLESIDTFRMIEDKRGTIFAQYNYAFALLDIDMLEPAQKYFSESLALAGKLGDVPIIQLVLSGIAMLNFSLDNYEKSAELCGLLLHQPEISEHIRQRTNKLVEELNIHLSDEILKSAINRGKSKQLEEYFNE